MVPYSVTTPDAPAPAPTQHAGPSKLHIGWIMPPFVRELPVDAPDTETAVEQLLALATSLMPDHPAEAQLRFALGLGMQLEPMTEANVIYAGLCFLEVEGRPSGSTIVVSQLPHDSEDDGQLLRTTEELLRLAHPDDDYRLVELPCGPALTRIGRMEFLLDAHWSPTGAQESLQQSLIQVYIPLPGTSELLVFELGAPESEDWDLHSELFAEILKTIDWGTDQEIADYRTVQQSAPASAEPDEAVTQELYRHSSRLLDAIALRGRMSGGTGASSITCSDCWSKGLRSACSAQHSWQIEEVAPAGLAEVVPRVTASLSAKGWQAEPTENGMSVCLRASEATGPQAVGHTLMVTVRAEEGRIAAQVTSPCARRTVGVDSAFG
ncbi:hypothetical protein [Streptomyces chrestomyceticus]|uniref:hypothetical protein n=1 Tax=Streptomyces chrestomyceticus TaxID=68185 RepID=UPI0004C721BB